MINRILLSMLVLSWCSLVYGQRFTPNHSYGIQLNYSNSFIFANGSRNTLYASTPNRHFDEGIHTVDIYGHYDFAFSKWFGFNTGLGFINRGAANDGVNGENRVRNLYYLAVPLKVQIKPFRMFWLEGGLEGRGLLFYPDKGYTNSNNPRRDVNGNEYYGPFNTDFLEPFMLSWQAGFRIHMLRGLSFQAYWQSHITYTATVPDDNNQLDYETNYENYSLSLGFRYMFNQK